MLFFFAILLQVVLHNIFYLSRIILYAISMADYEQDNVEACKDVLKTKDGIDRLILYHKSVGRLFHVPCLLAYADRTRSIDPEGYEFER